MNETFEYKIIRTNTRNDCLEEELNRLGRNGWELVFITKLGIRLVEYTLERCKNDNQLN